MFGRSDEPRLTLFLIPLFFSPSLQTTTILTAPKLLPSCQGSPRFG